MAGDAMWRRAALGAVLVAAVGCGDDPAGPGGGNGGSGTVSLSVVAPGTAGGFSAIAPAGFDVTQSDGTNTLLITRAAIVLREIELKRVDDDVCEDTISGADNDDCEEFEVGPRIFELPLDGGVDHVVEIAAPAGAYDELEFEVHKPDDDTPEDLAFVQQHPDFADVSVRVEGEFNGQAFVYLSDLNEEMEADLVPPLVVEEGAGPTNVTLSVDITTWFVAPGGTLVDPATANKGGPNEELVETNIERSIEGFEDRDRDGRSDD